MNATKIISIVTTKRGFPAMWESGGGMSNTGHVQIITGSKGEPRRPVYTRRSDRLFCGNHALIIVHEGFYVVNVSQCRGDFSVFIWRIVKTIVRVINCECEAGAEAEVELVNCFTNGEWEKPLDAELEAAVKAGQSKACIYHCRAACYINTSAKQVVLKTDQEERVGEFCQTNVKGAAMSLT